MIKSSYNKTISWLTYNVARMTHLYNLYTGEIYWNKVFLFDSTNVVESIQGTTI